MSNDRTTEQTNRVIEATAEAAKTSGARAYADVSGKAAKTAERAVEAGVEQAEQTTRQGAKVAQRTIEAGADQARRVTEASVQEAQRALDRSSRQLATAADQATRAARDVAHRASDNLDAVIQVVTTAASGYQSVVTELVDQGQQAFQRNVDVINQTLRVRNATDLLNIQTRYLHDSLGAVLNTSARISQISAKTAGAAAGTLQQRRSA
jgi:hypothetical protein